MVAVKTAVRERTDQRRPVPPPGGNATWPGCSSRRRSSCSSSSPSSRRITAILYAFSHIKLARGGMQRDVHRFRQLRPRLPRSSRPPVGGDHPEVGADRSPPSKSLLGLGAGTPAVAAASAAGRSSASLLIIPIIMPPVAVSIMWFFMYDYTFGIFNYLLNQVGAAFGALAFRPEHRSLRDDGGRRLAGDAIRLPPPLCGLPLPAARSLRGGRHRRRRPLARLPHGHACRCCSRSSLVVILLRLIDAARIFDKIFVMTRGGPGSSAYTTTLTIYVEGFNKFDFGYASALSFLFQIVARSSAATVLRAGGSWPTIAQPRGGMTMPALWERRRW